MHIIEDTRQHKGKHTTKKAAFEAAGDKVLACKLPFGDYARPPLVSVDTKANIKEIAQNACGGKDEHDRFVRELKLAREYGCQLFILIENEDGVEDLDDLARWENPDRKFRPRAPNGLQISRALATMQERYGAIFLFCRPEEAAETIKELLSNEDIRLD